jgi:hypothetical protein
LNKKSFNVKRNPSKIGARDSIRSYEGISDNDSQQPKVSKLNCTAIVDDGKSNPMSSRNEGDRKEKASAGIYSYDDLADTDNNDFDEKVFTPFGQVKERKECSFKESRPSFSVNRD